MAAVTHIVAFPNVHMLCETLDKIRLKEHKIVLFLIWISVMYVEESIT